MSTRDFFKNSVLEAFGQVDPAKIGLSLLVALAMGILIYYVYKRFFTGVVYCEPPGQGARVHDGHPLHGADHRR